LGDLIPKNRRGKSETTGERQRKTARENFKRVLRLLGRKPYEESVGRIEGDWTYESTKGERRIDFRKGLCIPSPKLDSIRRVGEEQLVQKK